MTCYALIRDSSVLNPLRLYARAVALYASTTDLQYNPRLLHTRGIY